MVKSVQTSYIYLFLLQENITVEMGPQFCYCAYFSNEKVGTEASYFGSFFFSLSCAQDYSTTVQDKKGSSHCRFCSVTFGSFYGHNKRGFGY